MKTIIVLMALLGSCISNAQDLIWVNELPQYGIVRNNIAIDEHENIYRYSSYDSEDSIYVQKEDSMGNVLWTTTNWVAHQFLNGGGNTQDIILDELGYPYISGAYNDSNTTYNYHMNVEKLDTNGNSLWVYRPGAGIAGSFAFGIAGSLAFGNDGNLLVTGVFSDTVDFDVSPTTDSVLYQQNGQTVIVKLSPDGAFQWVKQFGAEVFTIGSLSINAIDVNSVGDIFIAGTYSGTVDFDPGVGIHEHTAEPPLSPSYYGRDLYVMKLDSTASFQWVHTFPSSDEEDLNDMILTEQSLVILGKISGSVDFDPDSVNVQSINDGAGKDRFIASYDFNGNLNWVNQYSAYMNTLEKNSLDHVYGLGSFDVSADFSQNGTQWVTPIDQNLFILELNASGDFVDVGVYQDSSTAWGNRFVRSTDGDFYVTGGYTGPFFGLPSGQYKSFLMKLGEGGNQNTVDESLFISMRVHPNPARDLIHVESEYTMQSLHITNALGEACIESTTNHVDVSSLNTGVYFLTIHTEAGSARTRFIKE